MIDTKYLPVKVGDQLVISRKDDEKGDNGEPNRRSAIVENPMMRGRVSKYHVIIVRYDDNHELETVSFNTHDIKLTAAQKLIDSAKKRS